MSMGTMIALSNLDRPKHKKYIILLKRVKLVPTTLIYYGQHTFVLCFSLIEIFQKKCVKIKCKEY